MSPEDKIVNDISGLRWRLGKLPRDLKREVDNDLLKIQKKINTWKQK